MDWTDEDLIQVPDPTSDPMPGLPVEGWVRELMLAMVKLAIVDVRNIERMEARGDMYGRTRSKELVELKEYEPREFLLEQTMAHEVLGLDAGRIKAYIAVEVEVA